MRYGLVSMTAILFLTCSIFYGQANDVKSKSIDMQEYDRGYYDADPLPDKTVYLTFDDGPSDWTDNILDILKKENVHATFFIMNVFEKKDLLADQNRYHRYRDVLIRIVKEGHVIGNHTLTHPVLSGLSEEQIARELDQNQVKLNEVLGEYACPMTLIRPPFGLPFYKPSTNAVRQKVGNVLRKRGLIMMWTKQFDSNDSANWARGEWFAKGSRVNVKDASFQGKVERIFRYLSSRAGDKGAVILLHDIHLASVYALDKIIKAFKEKGFTFATLEDYVYWRWQRSSRELVTEENNKSVGDNSSYSQVNRLVETNPLFQ